MRSELTPDADDPSQQPPLIPFGGVELPLNKLEPHFFFLGTTGSGKTLSLRMLMKAALVAPRGGLRTRRASRRRWSRRS